MTDPHRRSPSHHPSTGSQSQARNAPTLAPVSHFEVWFLAEGYLCSASTTAASSPWGVLHIGACIPGSINR